MMNLINHLPRNLLIALSALALAACSGGETPSGGTGTPASGLVEMSKGDPNAPHTLIEYASTTCGAHVRNH